MRPKWSLSIIPLVVIIWILNTSKPGGNIEGCLDGCALPMENLESGIRVISLNMLHGFPRFDNLSIRLDLIAEEILRLQPDIVLIQEVPWTFKTKNVAKLLSEKTGMNYVYVRANGNRWAIGFEEGEAILSRFPILESDYIELDPSAGYFENRVVLYAKISASGRIIKLFVTHLTNKEPDINHKQSQALIDYIKLSGFDTIILGGDFNACPGTSQIEMIGTQLVDAYHFRALGDDGLTCCNDQLGSPSVTHRKRIDYIFISPDLIPGNELFTQRVFDQPFAYKDGWLWASDHVGLMLDLKFDP